jgi:hypothetical protein
VNARTALTAARARSDTHDFIGQVHGYCQNPDCSVRETRFTVKESDGVLTPSNPCCPACGTRLTIRAVRTHAEAIEDDEREARRNVNAQLYRQRHGPTIPIGALLDESLPGLD